jgi:hypothetical protein
MAALGYNGILHSLTEFLEHFARAEKFVEGELNREKGVHWSSCKLDAGWRDFGC